MGDVILWCPQPLWSSKRQKKRKINRLTLVAASLANLERKAVLIKSPILIEWF